MKLAMYLYSIYILICMSTKFYLDGHINKEMLKINMSIDSLVSVRDDYQKEYNTFKDAVDFKLNKGNKDSLLNVANELEKHASLIETKKGRIVKDLAKLGKLEPYQVISKKFYVHLIVMGFALFLIIGFLIERNKK